MKFFKIAVGYYLNKNNEIDFLLLESHTEIKKLQTLRVSLTKIFFMWVSHGFELQWEFLKHDYFTTTEQNFYFFVLLVAEIQHFPAVRFWNMQLLQPIGEKLNFFLLIVKFLSVFGHIFRSNYFLIFVMSYLRI